MTSPSRLPTLKWTGSTLELIDQTRLPSELVIMSCQTPHDVADAITRLVVRGAPAIGVAAAYGVLLGARVAGDDVREIRQAVKDAAAVLISARPTAVNLAWAVNRMVVASGNYAENAAALKTSLEREARGIENEDRKANRLLGSHGAALLHDGDVVLTHCNAGALATTDYGTALGVVYAAVERGKRISVFADETRPLLQGARLTTWELLQAGVPTTLICDSMAASVMARKKVSCVIVGADRIAANGDTANKIGTLGLAVLSRHYLIPFYVAAPLSTVDVNVPDGAGIPIEERSAEEVTSIAGITTAPSGVGVYNPAFDVTPGRLIDAIITEAGVVKPPYHQTLAGLKHEMYL